MSNSSPIPFPEERVQQFVVHFAGRTPTRRELSTGERKALENTLKELKDDKKIMLLPGEHKVAVRQAGYADFTQTILVEPGRIQILHPRMTPDPRAFYPGSDAAELKLGVKPDRAAVFVDDVYVGHAADFGGTFHSMLLTPGKHRVKVELPGYQIFETEVNLLPNQKSKVETDLVAGSIVQAGPLVKEP